MVGRGLIRELKRRYPTAQILPLDYDPDVSFANVENRLQMLVMGARDRAAEAEAAATAHEGAAPATADAQGGETYGATRVRTPTSPVRGNASLMRFGSCLQDRPAHEIVVGAVADAAHCNRGTFYYYFPDMEGACHKRHSRGAVCRRSAVPWWFRVSSLVMISGPYAFALAAPRAAHHCGYAFG